MPSTMDVVELSRLQFAFTAAIHFIFVPLSLGLSVLVAIMETKWLRTRDPLYLRMTRFWGKLFIINFALGVVTGVTLAFEFGMNWARFSFFVGDIFGTPLAAAAMTAFFLESTFIGVWVFGWKRVSERVHALSIWLVAIATNLSALWILLANGWMQAPVGYVLRNGRAEMVDFGALLTNPTGWIKFGHTVLAGYLLAGFFVMGVSAYHLLRKQNRQFFERSFRMAAIMALVAAILLPILGDFHGTEIAHKQPAKLAAMKSHWKTERQADFNLLVFPDVAGETNRFEALSIPGGMSMLLFRDVNAEVTGLRDIPPEDRPPVVPVFLAFRFMVALGVLFLMLSAIAVYLSRKGVLKQHPIFLRVMLYSIPLPYLAIQAGWMVAELGRQPWIVYGLMRTTDGVSAAITPLQVAISLVGFVLLYLALAVIDIYLLATNAKRGPEEPESDTESRSSGRGFGRLHFFADRHEH